MSQSIEGNQEIPKEDPVVMPLGGPRKRLRVCNLAAERRQEMRERTQGKVGCRLQEVVLPCKSGMAKKKPHQENSDLGKSVDGEGSSLSPD
jgi:hypothetical protein